MLRALAGECADARHPEQLRREDSRRPASFFFVNKKRTRFSDEDRPNLNQAQRSWAREISSMNADASVLRRPVRRRASNLMGGRRESSKSKMARRPSAPKSSHSRRSLRSAAAG